MDVGRRALLSTLGAGAVAAGVVAAVEAVTGRGPEQAVSAPAPAPATPAVPRPAPRTDTQAVVARFAASRPGDLGTALPGIVTHVAGPAIALTLDACGGGRGRDVDRAVLDALREHAVPATLFLNLRWVRANEAVARELAADPLFEIGNHGSRHVPLTLDGRQAYGIGGTRGSAEAVAEVWENQQVLTELCGRAPRWFRSGTAHYDAASVEIVHALGLQVAGFAVNGDEGATASARRVQAAIAATPPGGIVLLHMNRPHGHTAEGLRRALPGLTGRRLSG